MLQFLSLSGEKGNFRFVLLLDNSDSCLCHDSA